MQVRILLRGGGTHIAEDERTPGQIVDAVAEVINAAFYSAPHPHDHETPSGWVWIADGFFRAVDVSGVVWAP